LKTELSLKDSSIQERNNLLKIQGLTIKADNRKRKLNHLLEGVLGAGILAALIIK
jgi:hypothetical protein